MTTDNVTLVQRWFVLADGDGHALAVLDSKDNAHLWAATDAREGLNEGETLAWTVEYSEDAAQWTKLCATTGGDIVARYVITELPDLAPVPAVMSPQRRQRIDVAPHAPVPPETAPTTDEPSAPDAAAGAAVEPAENPESAEPPELPDCGGRYEGCNGQVESAAQLHASKFRQRIPLCKNCFDHEAENDIPPRVDG